MSTIAELELPAEEFALAETFGALPDLEVEVVRVVAFDREQLLPFVWLSVEDVSTERLHEVLDADPSVENVERLAELEHECLYQMNWVSAIRLVVHVLLDQNATVLTAFGRSDRWLLRVLFPDRDSLSETYDYCEREEISVSIGSIYELKDRRRGQYGLTGDQYESLITASEMGYYGVPRDATLSDVADQLGISHQALSERLRRGHDRLIRNSLVVGTDENSL